MNLSRILCSFRSEPHCEGCKYLYSEGVGFSNDQRTGTRLSCALNRQADLPKELALSESGQEVSKTLLACDGYASGRYLSFDVMGYEGASLYSFDTEQIDAITAHSKRPREGQPQSWAIANFVRIKAGA